MQILLENARIFDGHRANCAEEMAVLVEGDRIIEISDSPIISDNAHHIDLRGRTLMPGMIDLHIHVYVSDVDFRKMEIAGEAYRVAHAPAC